MSNPKRVDTPAGPATELLWPAGDSGQFRERIINSLARQPGATVNVTPVLLDSGEVRFYPDGVLTER
ncbi:hypothetical protein KN200_15795 (plasmid) [Clavibacter michiganensis subsp. michiganensis]|uniref:hypothetical protein n=1 Tax=Clavibacter michiganensis TaxID=28447 RepID=UPI0011D26B0D|nr:hypothetical protein [Clavibacter michiganensis]MDO4101244.1 hypothetical protein [Clavibacter michiganensis]MDO4129130.1 hypothetical protein [Clavibacter michiganensis]QXP07562.1 hypothetical protein KN200_15795 [Clavibacter michiganensis subsp. michiganensis]